MKSSSLEAFRNLSNLQYACGVIDIDELNERIQTYNEMVEGDSREFRESSYGHEPKRSYDENAKRAAISPQSKEDNIYRLVPMGLSYKWVFTKGDPDPFPSVPHGHLDSQNASWPKLNPYTGWAYSASGKKIERLTKREMKTLWNDDAFVTFCYEHVSWFIGTYPHFHLPTKTPLRFPKWR